MTDMTKPNKQTELLWELLSLTHDDIIGSLIELKGEEAIKKTFPEDYKIWKEEQEEDDIPQCSGCTCRVDQKSETGEWFEYCDECYAKDQEEEQYCIGKDGEGCDYCSCIYEGWGGAFPIDNWVCDACKEEEIPWCYSNNKNAICRCPVPCALPQD